VFSDDKNAAWKVKERFLNRLSKPLELGDNIAHRFLAPPPLEISQAISGPPLTFDS
jgi:hypothetical protein